MSQVSYLAQEEGWLQIMTGRRVKMILRDQSIVIDSSGSSDGMTTKITMRDKSSGIKEGENASLQYDAIENDGVRPPREIPTSDNEKYVL